MKLKAVLIFSAIILLGLTGMSMAEDFTYSPTPPDLADLPHDYWYIWGIDDASGLKAAIDGGQVIKSASITFNQIYNWASPDPTNILYVHLFGSTPTSGVGSGWDGSGGGDYFAGNGLLLGTYTDVDGPQTKIDLTYFIPAGNYGWLADGNFGFGFDPDCHFYNSGVTLTVTTGAVPEPGILMLLGTGLLGLGFVSRRRMKR